MKKNSLLKQKDEIVRVLEIKDSSFLIIDCIKRTMPEWKEKDVIVDWMSVTEQELWESTGFIQQRWILPFPLHRNTYRNIMP